MWAELSRSRDRLGSGSWRLQELYFPRFAIRNHPVLGIDLDPEFAQPGQPGAPARRSRAPVVGRDVVEQDAPLGSLVVAANPGAAGRAPNHDGDAVELFVAGVEYHSCHRVPIREPSAVSLQSRFALRYSLAPAVSVECSDEIRRE